MDFRDTLSALLPPHRDDEPAGLRQDILDELVDHLISSYHRELLRGSDPAAARARAMERFGDPAAVARRLWLDAMRGKIMTQRVLVATCLVVMLACITAVGLSWHWINQDQLLRSRAAAEAIEANRRMSEALAQAHATNKDMLTKLSEMSEAIRHPRSPDWNPVTFKLTEETPDGPPVAKADLNLSRSGENPAKTIHRVSDAKGVADFGSVQPGDYRINIHQGFANGYQTTSQELNIEPSSVVHRSIVCPKAPPDPVPVLIKCDWPADLEKERLVLYAPFDLRGRTIEPGIQWALYDKAAPVRPRGQGNGGNPGMMAMMNQPSSFLATRSVLCGPGMTRTEILHSRGLLIWGRFSGNLADQVQQATKLGPGGWADVLVEDLRDVNDPSEAMKWEPGTYGLNELIVLRPTQSPDVETGRRRFDVLVAVRRPNFGHGFLLWGRPPAQEYLQTFYSMMAGPRYGQPNFDPGLRESSPTLELPAGYWREVYRSFEALPGQVNKWAIPLPDELIKAVREALKVDPTAKAKPAGPATRADDKK